MIEQSGKTGLDLYGTNKVTVSGMFFDDNGRANRADDSTPGIAIDSVNTASICANHFTGNGGIASGAAQIRFSRVSNGLSFCGNTYAAENQSDFVELKPAYVYTMAPGAILTDTHFYESPPVQA